MKSDIQALAMATVFLLAPMAGVAQNSATVQAIGPTERAALFPTRDMIDYGQAVVEANCASCHGMDGLSDAKGKPSLAGQRTVYLYRIQKVFQAGKRTNESNKHTSFLNDKAMLSAAAYYANQTPAPIVRTTETSATDTSATDTSDGADAADRAVATDEDPFFDIRGSMKKCIKCHGEKGSSPKSGSPSLTAQDPEYFLASMMAYVNGNRSHKLMKKRVGRLDEATIRQMGVFYAVQEPLKSATQGQGDARVGRRLAEDCATCHGDDGNAKKSSTPTLAGQDAKYFVRAMTKYQDGKRLHTKMVEAVEELSEQDIIDLATYYAAEEPHRRDVRMPLKSTEWIARCERCHGIDGNSTDPRFPMLAGQDKTYLRNALQAYATGTRDSPIMYAMVDLLTPANIERISTYFAAQQPKAVVYIRLPNEDGQQE